MIFDQLASNFVGFCEVNLTWTKEYSILFYFQIEEKHAKKGAPERKQKSSIVTVPVGYKSSTKRTFFELLYDDPASCHEA